MAGVPDPLRPVSVVMDQETPWAVLPGDPDLVAQAALNQYIQNLSRTGLSETAQGVWLQAGPSFLASNQGTTPLPAAS